MTHLPPIQALKAFEAAARQSSYSRAAEELGLTHGAVSHHISRLERETGTRLFVREGQRMLLTDAGQRLVLGVRQGLKTIESAFAQERTRGGKAPALYAGTVTLSTVPSFATLWLVPRLPQFQALHPEIDVAIRASTNLAVLDGRDGIDLAIRYGPGGWKGVKAERLKGSLVFPVASPAYREGDLPLLPRDLNKATLLRNPRQPWRPWFAAAELDWDEPARGPMFDDSALALQAAIAGQGITLTREVLAEDDLDAGRLIRLFDVAIEDDYAWYLVTPRVRPTQNTAAAIYLGEWLKQQMSREPRLDRSWLSQLEDRIVRDANA